MRRGLSRAADRGLGTIQRVYRVSGHPFQILNISMSVSNEVFDEPCIF